MVSVINNHPAQQKISQLELRKALSMFATGVTIITARTQDGIFVGLTANSFNSVSLSPPLVLWSLAQSAGSLSTFMSTSHYAINVLRSDQQGLARRFSERNTNRFFGVGISTGQCGAPLIDGAIATFQCFNRSQYVEGDHVIFVGEVEICSYQHGASPLLYHGGQFYDKHPL